jgi:hypothetical protein
MQDLKYKVSSEALDWFKKRESLNPDVQKSIGYTPLEDTNKLKEEIALLEDALATDVDKKN